MIRTFAAADVARYLALARELGTQRALYDFHVHLTDVFDQHVPNLDSLVVFRCGSRESQPGFFRELTLAKQPGISAELRNATSRMIFEQVYRREPVTDLLRQMEVTGISSVLALPVAHPQGDVAEQISYLDRIRSHHSGVMLGYAVAASDGLDAEGLYTRINSIRSLYDIKALKLHTNISEIDLTTPEGRRRATSIVQVCGATGLPLIVHGGASPILSPRPCCDFGRLEHLALLDWKTAGPVIIAHAGVYGCSAAEIDDALPLLKDLLVANDNLYVDTSGLTSEVLEMVLRRVGVDRLVFGSDALYHPLWRAIVCVLHAIGRVGLAEADTLRKIAGETPERLLKLSS